jgi:membrane associated rhomboid family serine protease
MFNETYGIEKMFGSFRFLILYLFSGIGGNVFTFMLKKSPLKLGFENSLGASGAVYGITGAISMYRYRNRNVIGKKKEIELEKSEGVKGPTNLIFELIYNKLFRKNVNNLTLLGGFFCGALFSLLFGPLYRIKR